MQKYELTVVLDPKATAAKRKGVEDQIEKIVKAFEGKVEKSSTLGDAETGQALHFLLELASASVAGLVAKLNGEEAVKKHLLVKSKN